MTGKIFSEPRNARKTRNKSILFVFFVPFVVRILWPSFILEFQVFDLVRYFLT